jgi:hypothetical protein
MLRRWLLACVLGFNSLAAWAIAPYIVGERVAAGEWQAVASDVEKKLSAAGFQLLGRYAPQDLPTHGVVLATDAGMLRSIRELGGATIVAAPIRVGFTTDGAVSYANPDYWYRAFLRTRFPKAEAAARSVQSRLAQALGAGPGFGGDETAANLPRYRYIFGMERFDDKKNLLATHASFEEALKTVRDNLARGVAGTAKVYEVVLPERKLAVIGVAMNSPVNGDAAVLRKIGAEDRIAGYPYEIFLLDREVHAFYARYRLALAFPDLGMGTFMRIVYAPEEIHATLKAVAGGR